MEKTFRIYNFGCKVNQEEGGMMAALFLARGWQQAEPAAAPGLVIINTCTVTQVADKKARNLIRRLRRSYPTAVLAVCGCYAQRAASEILAISGVDIVAGVDERARLPELVAAFGAAHMPQQEISDVMQPHSFCRIAPLSDQSRSRAYLKIEDGCDQFCHYCIIPYVRGPVRSLDPDAAFAEAKRLVASGHCELVLTGIHIGAYGRDLQLPDALPALCRRICALPALQRLRLGSIEPQQFSPALLTWMAEEAKFCPHLHIPLQAGCDKTLRAMGRRYDTAFYADLLAQLRQLKSGIAITTDVMVGYPGETEEDFAQTLAFCRAMGFAGLHVFPYSRRQDTPAATAPDQVSEKTKAERAARLGTEATYLSRAYAERFIDQPLDFLPEDQVEITGQAYWRGHSGNYLTLLLADSGRCPGYCMVSGKAWTAEGLLVNS